MSDDELIELDALRDAARGLLGKSCDSARVRSLLEDPLAFDEALWQRIVELGWPAIAVPEEHGGAGAGLRELLVVATELGRALAPGPFFASGVLAVAALSAPEAAAATAPWLAGVAAGERVMSVAMFDEHGAVGGAARASALPGGTVQVVGELGYVPDGHSADALVVASATEGGEPVVVIVERDGFVARSAPMIDLTRRFAHVGVDAVVPGERVVARGSAAAALTDRILNWGAAAVAADSLGIGERALAGVVDYAKQRVQFGRLIGSFQAYKHRCADLLIDVEATRAVVSDAARALDGGDPRGASRAVSLAKASATDRVARIAGEALQLHGGIGYTWEHDCHLQLKRAKLNQTLFGDSRWHRRRLAALVLGGDAAG